jgi:hypothetical protein
MIIDNINNLEISETEIKKYSNELKSLGYLSNGLNFLYKQVSDMESIIQERLPNNQVTVFIGNIPLASDIPQGLVACFFHWYAVSVCNFIRLIGWLVNDQDSSAALRYINQVAPNVKIWRDKVGAHFARIKPNSKDTPADLAMSVMFPISFDNDAFYAASLALTISSSGKSSTSRKDMRWSLTHTHRDLSKRFSQIKV